MSGLPPSAAQRAEVHGKSVPPTPPAPEPVKKRSAVLKWGLIALVVAVVAAGLGLLYVYAPGTAGLSAPESGPADPDDPRDLYGMLMRAKG